MKRQKTTTTGLVCSECGNIMYIARKSCKQKKLYHIKDLFCIRCLEITKHIELKDLDIKIKEFEFSDKLNEEEQKVYELIKR